MALNVELPKLPYPGYFLAYSFGFVSLDMKRKKNYSYDVFSENITFVLLRDLSLEQMVLPSNNTIMCKAFFKTEILLKVVLGMKLLDENDRQMQLFPSI